MEKSSLLKSINLFSTLRESELAVVAENSQYYEYNKGEVIFNEGDYTDGIYIVSSGEILITKETQDGSSVDLARYIEGESFGELDLLDNTPVNARALAESDARLLIFPSRGIKFQEVLENHPMISARMLHKLLAIIAGRIRNTNRLVSEKSQWIEDLRMQLMLDKLTGLYNRVYLDEEFSSELAKLGDATSLAMVKPDNFKVINDTYGHEAGDKALRLIADSLRAIIGTDDIAVRYRGDEFALILPGSRASEARKLAERILSDIKGLSVEQITGGKAIILTVSIGIAAYPDDEEDPQRLIKLSFDRMFEAREKGGDRILPVA